MLECITESGTDYFRYLMTGSSLTKIDSLDQARKTELINAIAISPTQSEVEVGLATTHTIGFDDTEGKISTSVTVAGETLTAELTVGARTVSRLYTNVSMSNSQQVFGDGFTWINNTAQISFGSMVLTSDTVGVSGITFPGESQDTQLEYIIHSGATPNYFSLLGSHWAGITSGSAISMAGVSFATR